ncbi:MAG: flagella basal body P-ring formation protein FlgA [Kofleriaceae bacterium]
MRALLVIVLFAGIASADPVADAISDQLQANLPDNLGIAQVFVPSSLAKAAPDKIIVEPPTTVLHAGRPSVKVIYKKQTYFVPVALSALVDVAVTTHPIAAGSEITADDVTIEHRAFVGAAARNVIGATTIADLDAGAAIGSHDVKLAAPTPRGSRVSVEIVHGSVKIKGTGTLELPARIGEPASVRLAFNNSVVKGTLTGSSLVTVEE